MWQPFDFNILPIFFCCFSVKFYSLSIGYLSDSCCFPDKSIPFTSPRLPDKQSSDTSRSMVVIMSLGGAQTTRCAKGVVWEYWVQKHTHKVDQPCLSISSIPTCPSWVMGSTLPGWTNTVKVSSWNSNTSAGNCEASVTLAWKLWHGKPQWSAWCEQKKKHTELKWQQAGHYLFPIEVFYLAGTSCQQLWIQHIKGFRIVWGENSDAGMEVKSKSKYEAWRKGSWRSKEIPIQQTVVSSFFMN